MTAGISSQVCVGVLMGGVSSERDISIKSGTSVLDALRRVGVNAVKLEINTDERSQVVQLIRDAGIDLAFIALHGKFGEDGTIQEILSDCGIPYTGSGVNASKTAFDKALTQNILKKNNIPVPSYVTLNVGDSIDERSIIDELEGLPLILKPAREGSSIGVTVVHDAPDFRKALDDAFEYCDTVLVEQYIRGRELTVGILDGSALPVVEIIPKHGFFDFECKYTKGSTDYIVPADIPSSLKDGMQSAALRVHDLLGCEDFSRVDFMVDADLSFYTLEINTIPGFTETSLLPKAAKETGLDFDQLCLKLTELAYAKKEATKDSSIR